MTVSNATELKAALDTAKAGETILLKAGQYGDFEYANKHFAADVTIKTQDQNRAATFTSFNFSDVSHITVDGVKFDYRSAKGTPEWKGSFLLSEVDHFSILNSQFDGAVGSGLGAGLDKYGVGVGLKVRDSDSVTIQGNEFVKFFRGATFSGTSHLVVQQNNVHHIASDGFDFIDVDYVDISKNVIHDFNRARQSTAHPDMIQFWTAGTSSPSTHIKISENFLYQGEGQHTQTIFMGNEAVRSSHAGKEMFYRDVSISGNVIKNSHYHGISVGQTLGLDITGNTIVPQETIKDRGRVAIPSVNVAVDSENVRVEDNIVPNMGGGLTHPHKGWHVNNNHFIQIENPGLPNYVGHIFEDGFDTNPEWSDFAVIKGAVDEFAGSGAVHIESLKIPEHEQTAVESPDVNVIEYWLRGIGLKTSIMQNAAGAFDYAPSGPQILEGSHIPVSSDADLGLL